MSSLAQRIKDTKRIVIKIGSARVSNESSKKDFLFHLTNTVRFLREQKKEVILVSSGAVASGKLALENSKSEIASNGLDLKAKQALAAIGQIQLMKLYESYFANSNLQIAQILFGKSDLENPSSLSNLKNTFEELLKWGTIPIVNENDSTSTEEMNFGDNDFLSAMVSLIVGADMLFLLTGVDGFLVNETVVSLISKLEEIDWDSAKGPTGVGTGGMLSKLKSGGILHPYGIITSIQNGEKPNIILEYLGGKPVGTTIYNQKEKQVPSLEDVKKIFGGAGNGIG